jgi:hypothetical protein
LLSFCTKGIEIYENGFDPNTISRGLNQLRYALPNLVAQESRAQINVWNEEDLLINFICPILVTTADLYVLKSGLDLQDFQSASSLTDISNEVDALIAYQESGPHLYSYCDQVAQSTHKRYPEIKRRLEEVDHILKEIGKPRTTPSVEWYNEHFITASTRILVVRFSALDQIMKVVQSSVMNVRKSSQRIARLTADLKKRERHFVTIVPE